MVIAKLSGGLGNQMFQYAAAIAMADYLECDCKFDLSWFTTSDLHNGLEINSVFGIDLPVASVADFKAVLGWKWPIIRLLGSRLLSKKISFLVSRLVFTEKSSMRYCDGLPDKNTGYYMVGYWQSEEFFLGKTDLVRSIFKINDDIGFIGYKQHILDSDNSVSMHVRRGDYVTDKQSNQLLGECSVEYYREAALNIEKELGKSPVYFVFSDDLQWVEEKFSFLKRAVFVRGNTGSHSYLDMYLMSLCKHHIIANSSFSWWGAWLNSSPNKIVYTPTPWFNNAEMLKSICPAQWNSLDKSGKGLLVNEH